MSAPTDKDLEAIEKMLRLSIVTPMQLGNPSSDPSVVKHMQDYEEQKVQRILHALREREAVIEREAGLIRAISEVEGLYETNGMLRMETSTRQLIELLDKLKGELASLKSGESR